jgi:hypothetical protein
VAARWGLVAALCENALRASAQRDGWSTSASLAAVKAVPRKKPEQIALREWAPTHGAALRDSRQAFITEAQKPVDARLTRMSNGKYRLAERT